MAYTVTCLKNKPNASDFLKKKIVLNYKVFIKRISHKYVFAIIFFLKVETLSFRDEQFYTANLVKHNVKLN